jgi:hypothetical protein
MLQEDGLGEKELSGAGAAEEGKWSGGSRAEMV